MRRSDLSTALPTASGSTLLMLFLTACSAAPPAATVATSAPPTPSAVAIAEPLAPPDDAEHDLELRLTAVESDYRAGIELLADGEERLGREQIGTARGELARLVEDCRERPVCDQQPIIELFDRLLEAQAALLAGQSSQIADLEAGIEPEESLEPGSSPFVSSMPQTGEAQTMFRGTDPGQMIELNGPIEAALDDWLTWKRPLFMDAWENYQYLRPAMAPVYEEAGLPEALLFGILAQETGGRVHAVSKAGASGPLQFMRHTGRRYGLDVQDGFDLRFDPTAAARANAAYLEEQLAVVGQSIEKALAAYNGGENRMRGLQRRYGDVPLWDQRIFWALPRETRSYVPQVLAAAWLFLHAETYGLELPTVDSEATTVALPADLALSELAICLGQVGSQRSGWFRTLRNLNPRLEPGERVPAGEMLRVPTALVDEVGARCSDGPVLELARELHDANYPAEPEMIRYRVANGDTLGRIASRFGCASVGALAGINGIHPPGYVIRLGQTLKIPQCR